MSRRLQSIAALALVLAIPNLALASAAPRALPLHPRVTAPVLAPRLAVTPEPNPDPTDAPSETSEAETLFAEGEAAYEAGEFDAAAERFAAAHRIAPHPATLYNLGMAQHRSGQLLAAYDTFEEVQGIANTPDERNDAIAARQRVRRELSAIVVMVRPNARVCFDDAPLAPDADQDDRRERLVLPGAHDLAAFGRSTEVDLRPGETQTLWLDSWAEPSSRPGIGPAGTVLIATAGVAGAAALGTGIGAFVADDRQRARGMAAGSATAGAVALISSVAAIALVARRNRSTGKSEPAARTECGTTP